MSDPTEPVSGTVERPEVQAVAVAAGMTPAEARVWDLVSRAAGLYLRLTENEPGHGMEREEVCHAFHVVQGWLLGRPTTRAIEDADRRAVPDE